MVSRKPGASGVLRNSFTNRNYDLHQPRQPTPETWSPRKMKPAVPPPGDERRSKPGLRALIDEMMTQLRAASNQDVWTPEARARAEADLQRIMETVRRQAVGQDDASPEEGSDESTTASARRR
jgi:hypothetical protein